MRSGVDFEMSVVGEDTLNGAIQSMAAELRLSERVRFLGFLPQRQLRPIVEAADLMILSSRHEAGPLAMLEAAVAGVPTVGTLPPKNAVCGFSAEAAILNSGPMSCQTRMPG